MRPLLNGGTLGGLMAIPSGYFWMVASLPTPWPPVELRILHKQQINGCNVDLLADSTGRLGFSVTSGDESRLHMFQPILLSERGMSAIDFGWSDAKGSMRFRGVELLEDPLGDAPTVYFDLSSAPKRPPPSRLFEHVAPQLVTTPEARFFLETIVDIDTKLTSGDRYQIVRAAGLLRQLVLDSTRLIDVANRAHRLRLTFSVLDPEHYPPIEMATFWRDLDPSAFPHGRVVEIGLDRLMRSNMLWHRNTWATVRDVIKACANAKGGVHFGRPENDGQEVLLQFDSESIVANLEPSLSALCGVCRIVLKGAAPLVAAVSAAG